MRHPRATVPVGLALTVVLALSGCSSGDTAGSAEALASSLAQAAESAGELPPGLTTPEGGPADPTATSGTAEAVVAPVTREIGKTGWYGGFAVTVDEVTAEPGFGSAVAMTAELTFENLGLEADSPPLASVEADGLVVDADADAPNIPPGGKAKGTVLFTVSPDGETTLEQAIDQVTLVYGDAGDNQTLLPLAEGSEVESIEPRDLAVTGNLTQGQIVVDVVSARIAPSYESGEKGKALLDVRVKLTCAPDCNASGWNTGFEQFSVTDPAGNSVVADQRSEYCCDALYPETVSDNERNILTFIVPLPGDGEYTLTYDNEYITSTGVAPAKFSFTV